MGGKEREIERREGEKMKGGRREERKEGGKDRGREERMDSGGKADIQFYLRISVACLIDCPETNFIINI